MVKPTSEEPASPDAGPLNDLVVACLSRMGSEGEGGLEALCREYPEHAERLRTRMRLLREAGLLPAGGVEGAFPEHLGDFRLIERLGGGGMGVVYLAEQDSLGRRVALKLIRPEQLYFPGARGRFRARGRAAVARLAHPGIVPVHAVGEERGHPVLRHGARARRARSRALSRRSQADGPAELGGARLLRALVRPARLSSARGEPPRRRPSPGTGVDACICDRARGGRRRSSTRTSAASCTATSSPRT